MTQETLNQPTSNVNISFQQKSIGLSLVITSGATLYYVANVWPLWSADLATDTMSAGYGRLVLTTIGLIIITEIVLQTVLAMGAGSVPAVTEHQKAAAVKAKRNAYLALTIGMFAIVGSAFWYQATPFEMANLAIIFFAIAEIVKFASQLFYGRR